MAPFPADFLWGVATSAFQIEGGAAVEGRGEPIWARFAATPGAIADGSHALVACDHYARWQDDVALLQWLGVNAYRFSIAWPRVIPSGSGLVNERGLDFYCRLVDALLETGIQPFVTLYHWDLPQVLQDRGGWRVRATAEAFVEYADAVSRRLGDRVRYWATHNEPWCVATLGHETGHHAPGWRDPAESLRVAHHLLLSHGWAAHAVRRNAPNAEVGIVLLTCLVQSATESAADRDAAREADGVMNRWYLDPLFRARYPADAVADRVRLGHLPGDGMPFVEANDLQTIATPLDFLGVNYYSRTVVRANDDGRPTAVAMARPEELTDMGWEVYPQGLTGVLDRIRAEYAPAKIYITENGAAHTDPAGVDGEIADTRRVAYLQMHVDATQRAVDDGVPVAGYFAWSFLDNFEWAHGYAKRFGLFDVDYATQRRTPRASAHWFRHFIAAGGVDDAASRPIARRST